MKIIVLIILAYTIYLNILQTNSFKVCIQAVVKSENVMSQLNINIICSYIFTLFLGLVVYFCYKNISIV